MDVTGNNPLKRAVLALYEPLLAGRIIRRAALVGAVTLAHLQSSQAARLVDEARVVEVPNGVDTGIFHLGAKSPEIVVRHGLEGKTVALFVGKGTQYVESGGRDAGGCVLPNTSFVKRHYFFDVNFRWADLWKFDTR